MAYPGEFSGSTLGGGGGAGGGGGFGAYSPYLQLLLSLAQGLGKPGIGAVMGEKAQKMGAARGVKMSLPSEPSILSKRRQTGMQVGETALNLVPVAGPFLSAGASALRTAKTAGAQQKYLSRILSQNPDLFKQGETQFQSEFVPQGNWLANYASGQPKFMQRGAEKMTSALTGGMKGVHGFSSGAKKGAKRGSEIGTVVMPGLGTIIGGAAGSIMGGVGGKVFGSKEKQRKREEELHAANIKKAKRAEESMQVQQQDQRARALANLLRSPMELPPYLQQLLHGPGPRGSGAAP